MISTRLTGFMAGIATVLTCSLALAEGIPDRTQPGLALEDSGWQAVAGTVTPRDNQGVLSLPRTQLERHLTVRPGLYEMQVQASGSGMLTLKACNQQRTLRAVSDSGLYGLLFEVTSESDVKLDLDYQGTRDELLVEWTALVKANDGQMAAWKAAEESFALLGYYGTDPQRPAPGTDGTQAAQRSFSAEDLDAWKITETVVFYDAGYDAYWVDDPAAVASFFARRGLPLKNAVETEAWLKAHAEGDQGVGTSIIIASDVVPDTVVHPPFADCLLAKYLRAGGRVVALANIPLYSAQGAKGPAFQTGRSASEEILGLTYDKKTAYGMSGKVVLTAASKAWGLEPTFGLGRPHHTRSVTIPFVTDTSGEFCGAALVNLRPELPFSGLILVPDHIRANDEAMLRNAWRLARYTGAAVTVPEPAPLPVPALPIEAALRFGEDDLRMVYLRGEPVPLYLHLKALSGKLEKVNVHYALREGDKTLFEQTVDVSIDGTETNRLIGKLDLSGLRVGKYHVDVTMDAGGASQSVSRELRIGPVPDHGGTHIAIWCDASSKVNRTEDLFEFLMDHNLDPMFSDELPIGRDLALWHGLSFSTRHHGKKEYRDPPGYDSYRRGGSGEIMRVRAWGDKRESRGYASPFRRQAEAASFGEHVAFDNRFPAFRKRTVTGDDYSQWFGLDYNRFNVEAFKDRHGIEPPRPEAAEDPYATPNYDHAPGIIPDDEPWMLLTRYWCETMGDMGRLCSRAMEGATGGTGKVGPIPGHLVHPLIDISSGQYPPLCFGKADGFNLSCSYYYNTFWQPPLVHFWWLETARMDNRGIEQWLMPDCYYTRLECYYRNNLWLLLAGGAQGLPYFQYTSYTKPEALEAMKAFGAWSKRYGLLLDELRPVRKKVAMLVPFENVAFNTKNGFLMAYPFMNLLLAKVDAEPVAAEELDAQSIRQYEAVVLAETKWLKAGTQKLLEDYIAGGGKVVLDSTTAAVIPIQGAKVLDFPLGESSAYAFGRPERIAQIREAFRTVSAPVVDCSDPYVAVRRAALPDGTPGVWLVHNYTPEEYKALRDSCGASARDTCADDFRKSARQLEDRLGYRHDVVRTEITRADDGRIPFDVFNGSVLKATSADGVMTVALDIPKWEGKLVLFLPALPAQLELSGVRGKAKADIPLTLGVKVRDQAGELLKTPLPLKLTVRDPQGNENREYSRRLLTKDGKAAHTFAFARNDLRGIWTFEVEDVLSGIKASSRVRLK